MAVWLACTKQINGLHFVMSSQNISNRTVDSFKEEAMSLSDGFENWNRWIAKALDELDDPVRMAETVLCAMASLAPVESCYAIRHSNTSGTHVIAALPPDSTPAFAISPIDPTPNEHHLTRGCFQSKGQHPRFETSRRYQRMCHHGEFVDEIVHVTPLSSSSHIFLGAARSKSQGCFLNDELSIHEAVQPLLNFLSPRIARVSNSPSLPAAEETTDPLQDALQCFEKKKLTAREHQVMVLLLQGNDIRTAADKLGIAPDTVRSHRKHLYSKTATNSQGELFFKFLEFVRSGHFKKV